MAIGHGRVTPAFRVDQRGGHQSPGRAGLHALATGHTGARAHGVVEVEHHFGIRPAIGQTNHIIHLHFPAGPHAQIAVDAGIQIDAHGGVGGVLSCGVGRALWQAGFYLGDVNIELIDHPPEVTGAIGAVFARGLVGQQQFHHPLARHLGAGRGGAFDHHAGRRFADTTGGQRALALDLNHAGAAVAVGAVARRILEAQVRNTLPCPLGDLPQGFAGHGLDHHTIEADLKACG